MDCSSFSSKESNDLVKKNELTLLEKIALGKTVIITELDPPKTLLLDKFLIAAEKIRMAGTDFISLADNSLACVRTSNLAIAILLKEKKIPSLLHINCRDTNLIGLQSRLMGMASLGFEHILVITGDAIKHGDHPDASPVYDVNSITLLNIIRKINNGYTLSGTDLKLKTTFIPGVAFNPNTGNLDIQIERLKRKIASGGLYVMTQPVFDIQKVKTISKYAAQFSVPFFVGVWPLMNGRQAEFINTKVPGITICDQVMARMSNKEHEIGKNEGIKIAKEVTKAILDYFPGIYFITPFLAYQTIEELTAFVRSR